MDLGPLGLYKEINDIRPLVRDLCTFYATKNIDYLIDIGRLYRDYAYLKQ